MLGQPIAAGEAWAQARPRLPALLGVTVLVVLIALGLGVALPSCPACCSRWPVHRSRSLVLLVRRPGFRGRAASTSTSPSRSLPPAIVLERQPVVPSLRRSRRLVNGAWWRTFGILLLVNIIAQVISGILSLPFAALTCPVAYLGGDGDT